jgi:hypothetical protein
VNSDPHPLLASIQDLDGAHMPRRSLMATLALALAVSHSSGKRGYAPSYARSCQLGSSPPRPRTARREKYPGQATRYLVGAHRPEAQA